MLHTDPFTFFTLLPFYLSYIAAFTPNTPRIAVATAAMIFKIIDTVFFPFSLIVFSRLFLSFLGRAGSFGSSVNSGRAGLLRSSRFSQSSLLSQLSQFTLPLPSLREPCPRRSWAAPAPCSRSRGRARGCCPSRFWSRAGRAHVPT